MYGRRCNLALVNAFTVMTASLLFLVGTCIGVYCVVRAAPSSAETPPGALLMKAGVRAGHTNLAFTHDGRSTVKSWED